MIKFLPQKSGGQARRGLTESGSALHGTGKEREGIFGLKFWFSKIYSPSKILLLLLFARKTLQEKQCEKAAGKLLQPQRHKRQSRPVTRGGSAKSDE